MLQNIARKLAFCLGSSYGEGERTALKKGPGSAMQCYGLSPRTPGSLRFLAVIMLFAVVFSCPWRKALAETVPGAPPPPLGLGDALSNLAWADDFLSAFEASTATLGMGGALNRAIADVEQYSSGITKTNHIPYRWINIGRKRVSTGKVDTDEFSLDGTPIEGVMAVRFDVKGGDIYLLEMNLFLLSGARQAITLGQWVLLDIPKRDVLYLPEALDISKISISARKKWQEPARLIVDVGVPAKPDYAREATAFCYRALKSLEQKNYSSARLAIRAAAERLENLAQSLAP